MPYPRESFSKEIIKKITKIEQKYHLQEMVGQGQFGKVYKAFSLGENKSHKKQQIVAVKVIPNIKFERNSKLKSLLSNEMAILSNLSHENIIEFRQFIVGEKQLYMVYEYCDEGTLEDKITLKEDQLLIIFNQIVDALHEVQKHHILHRDIKPANILFKNGKVKIADWGFSRFLTRGQTTVSFIGSPAYMAPEILRNQQYTNKADIWSLGVVIYEALFGYCPWEAKKIKTKTLVFPEEKYISKELKNIVTKMLVDCKEKRINCKQLKKLLKQKLSSNSEKSIEAKFNQISSSKKQHCKNKNLLQIQQCTFLLEMTKISKQIIKEEHQILYLKLVQNNLSRILQENQTLKDHQKIIQIKKLISKQINKKNVITKRIEVNIHKRKFSIEADDKLKRNLTKSKGNLFLKNNPQSQNHNFITESNSKTSHKRIQISQKIIIKQVISTVLTNLQKVLKKIKVERTAKQSSEISLLKTRRKEEENLLRKQTRKELVELNCLLDLVVYRQIPEEYNKKSAQSYICELVEQSKNILIKLLNHKLLLIKQKYLDFHR